MVELPQDPLFARVTMTLAMMTVENLILAFGFPGMPEMLIVLFIALLLFGGAKLPSLMRNLGRSANEFKRGMSDSIDEDEPSESTDSSDEKE